MAGCRQHGHTNGLPCWCARVLHNTCPEFLVEVSKTIRVRPQGHAFACSRQVFPIQSSTLPLGMHIYTTQSLTTLRYAREAKKTKKTSKSPRRSKMDTVSRGQCQCKGAVNGAGRSMPMQSAIHVASAHAEETKGQYRHAHR